MRDEAVTIRPCHAIEEFERMVELEAGVWGFSERDVVPSQMYVVASKTGGQVFAAFVGMKMVGFVLAYPGIRAVWPIYIRTWPLCFRNFAIWYRASTEISAAEDALVRGIPLIEWTFDPLQIRNAYFNICRLGTIARRYILNAYGFTTSPLHAGLPTDRLVAEWHLDSDRVRESYRREPNRPSVDAEVVTRSS